MAERLGGHNRVVPDPNLDEAFLVGLDAGAQVGGKGNLEDANAIHVAAVPAAVVAKRHQADGGDLGD